MTTIGQPDVVPADHEVVLRSPSRRKDDHQWIHGMAHDMRGPLSAVLGYLDMLRRQAGPEVPPTSLRYLACAHEAAQRLNQMVSDLLDIVSCREREGILMDRQHFSIHGLFERLSHTFAGQAESKGLTLEFKILYELKPVWADAKQMERLFDNLLSNALKFTPAGGRVTVQAGWSAAGWNFEVGDTGRGIPPAAQSRIFERFEQVVSGDRTVGHGLGLAVVKAILEAHQGDIRLESEEGRGSRFIFRVPHRPPEAMDLPLTIEFPPNQQISLAGLLEAPR